MNSGGPLLRRGILGCRAQPFDLLSAHAQRGQVIEVDVLLTHGCEVVGNVHGIHQLEFRMRQPPSSTTWHQLLASISSAYDAWDDERSLVEDSFNLATAEMENLRCRIDVQVEKCYSPGFVAPTGRTIAKVVP